MSRRWTVWSCAAALVLVAAYAAMLVVRGPGFLPGVDEAAMRFWLDVRSPGPTRAARVFDEVGGGLVGGVVVPGVICAALLRWRGTRAAATFLVAAVFSALLVQVLKHVVSRDRPAEILVGSDFGSYPSGHVAHAATMTVVVALVVRRPWVWWVAARYVGLMMASRMYLGAHWLTDTVAGGLLGAAVAYLIWRWMGERPSVVPRSSA